MTDQVEASINSAETVFHPDAKQSDVPITITGVQTVVVNAEMRNWVFVKVETNQPGLYGWGEATLEWKTRAVGRRSSGLRTSGLR